MKKKSVLIRFVLSFLSLILTLTIIFGLAYLSIDRLLPDVEALKSVKLPIPMHVYTRDGKLLAEFGPWRRNLVTLKEVPPLMIRAFLATEDQRFLEHHGIDFYGLGRAIVELITTGNKTQGGSTITMQVARNFYLTSEKTFLRKFKEILLSLKIERELTKDQILELYLNKIFLGNRAYGVAAAADVYYAKDLQQLTLSEIAVIAGLPKAPSSINPFANPQAAKQRRDHVLGRMLELGYINRSQYTDAIGASVTADLHMERIQSASAPYVAEMVRDLMYRSFGQDSYTRGFEVYTTIDSQQQQAANQAVFNYLLDYDQRHGYRGAEKRLGAYDPKKLKQWLRLLQETPNVSGLEPGLILRLGPNISVLLANGRVVTVDSNRWPGARKRLRVGDLIRVHQQSDHWELTQIPKIQAALVSLNPQTGAIGALVGGFSYMLSQFNRVIQAQRQPGSAFKPFIYAAALAKGLTLASIFDDSPLILPGRNESWQPQNDNHRYNGPTRLRLGLVRSINTVSVRVLQNIGVGYALNYVTRFGFNAKKLPRNLSLALGTGEVTPLQLARGYAVFSNGGYLITPYLIDHITDDHGRILYTAMPKNVCQSSEKSDCAPRVIPEDIAFLITSALKDVTRYGTGSAALQLARTDIAGKTGTTSDYVDTWFTGFNGDVVSSVWVGFDRPRSVQEYGAKTALPLWIDFMSRVLQNLPEHTLPQPDDIVVMSIDPISGNVVLNGQPGSIHEFFQKDNITASNLETRDATSN
jgi:penicillin-binding protein 1A